MKEIEIRLLERMTGNDEAVGTLELAEFLGVSRARIKSLVKDINTALADHGAQIEGKTGRGNGYNLIISDREKYEEKRDRLLSSGGFETEPIKEPDYGDIATSFELDGFHFGYLLLSEYPKRMYFIGYRD
ncbi:MAG: HTH domain-containing protein, partial [Erysipelotrichaceae bacterium]|nr:HTH domain-containing protein [Erysipelotrichaceae bacterium]